MHSPRVLLLTTTATVTLMACDPVPLPATVEGTVQHAVSGLATDNNPGIVWDLLPASYQLDVREWCRQLARALPAEEYRKTFKVIRKFGTVIKQRSDFLAANAPLKLMLQMLGSVSEDDLAAALAATGDVFLILSRSDLQTPAGLAAIDPGEFLHGTGRRIVRSAIRAARITGQDPVASARATVVEVLASTETSASVRIRIEGQDLSLDFDRVEGRWIPVGFANYWNKVDTGVRDWIKGLNLQSSARHLQILDEVLADLDKLAETQSRSKFERLLMESISKYKKLLDSPR